MKKHLLLLEMMLLPIVANAFQYDAFINGIYYNFNPDDKTAMVTGDYDDYFGNIVIPAEVTYNDVTYSVTSIGLGAFFCCSGLTSVIIPNSVISIGDMAFCNSSLTSVTIGNSVTSIGEKAFSGCSCLSSIDIPNSVTSIGDEAFRNCSGLTSVAIPNSATEIRNYTFSGCRGLTSVAIPNSVTTIGNYTFKDCICLTSITIPNSVTSIGNCAFYGCSGLTFITIPNSVVSIGDYAFNGCTSLTSVLVPVTDFSAFCNNKIISLIASKIGKPVHLIDNDGNEINEYIIPDGVTSIGDNAFYNCSSLVTITIPNSVTSIGNNAFVCCSGLTSVNIGNSVTSIGEGAFSACSSLTSVIVPNSVTTIGEYAFYKCFSIQSLKLPDGLQIIKKNTFDSCSSLKSLTIPSSVELIFQWAFAYCYSLETIIVKPTTPPFLYDNSFSDFSVPLIVPTGCYDVYANAQGWKNFTNISDGKFKLIYIVDGQTYKTYDVEYGSTITAEPAPTKEGYTFSGWSEIPATMPAHDVTVTGTFSINKYKLTYIVDGETYKTYDVEYGAEITPEPTPDKEGYTFSGWSEIPETMPAHDVTVTGTFEVNIYKLTYIVDGQEYKSYEVEYGTAITPEAEPTKEHYTFSGWSEIPATMPAHDVTVTGTFSINSYKLIYLVDGEEYKTYEVEYGTAITAEPAPEKEGYTFSGWSDIPEIMPDHDVTVTGSFSINTYTLTYMLDGEVYKTYELEYGVTITPEAEPEKEGYTFSGWSGEPRTMPAYDVTVTGSFRANIYKLIYILDHQPYREYNVEYGTVITPEAEPTKEGYTFSGWSEIPETMPAHDVTVTGTFSINTYKMTYFVDGEEYKSYELEYGATITPEAEPTKDGYTFSGWSEIPEIMPAHDVTVTGTFSINSYKLTYLVDGEEYKSLELEYGAAITPEAEPTKEGYTFSGWNEIPEVMPAHDVTVTGSFSINSYKLTYLVDGGEYKSYELEFGAVITPELTPEKEGYIFSGWSEIPATMPAHDVTVTGSFTKGAYKLIYMVDGEVYKTIGYDYRDAITPEPEPTRDGYTFSGWSEIPVTMPAHDVTVTGTFSINSYKLTYMIDDMVYKEVMCEYGATIIPEPQPEGDYARFEWIGVPETMPANDVVVYASYETGIIDLLTLQGVKAIYAPNGKKLDKPQKGLNIVVMQDGTVRKVLY